MTLYRFIECDECLVMGPALWGPAITDADLWRTAEGEGWTRRAGSHGCPAHPLADASK